MNLSFKSPVVLEWQCSGMHWIPAGIAWWRVQFLYNHDSAEQGRIKPRRRCYSLPEREHRTTLAWTTPVRIWEPWCWKDIWLKISNSHSEEINLVLKECNKVLRSTHKPNERTLWVYAIIATLDQPIVECYLTLNMAMKVNNSGKWCCTSFFADNSAVPKDQELLEPSAGTVQVPSPVVS